MQTPSLHWGFGWEIPTAELMWRRTSNLCRIAVMWGVSPLSALHRSFRRLQLHQRAYRWAGWVCRGHKVVLEVRETNCNRMEKKLGRIWAPGHRRSLRSWPFTVNNITPLGIITETFISRLLNRRCQRCTLKKQSIWRNVILYWMQL